MDIKINCFHKNKINLCRSKYISTDHSLKGNYPQVSLLLMPSPLYLGSVFMSPAENKPSLPAQRCAQPCWGLAEKNAQNFFRLSYNLSVSLTNVGLLKIFIMTSISANYYLTSAAARARTMGAVSGNDEEAFVWIIPCCSDCHGAAT